MEKQTAIEWLISQNYFIQVIFGTENIILKNIIEQAKEMHKQEIIDAIKFGQDNYSDTTIEDKEIAEQYYNETFVAQK